MGVFTHWPNRITALRFLGAVALFVIFAAFGDRPAERVHEIRGVLQLAFWLFTLTAATDFLDGYLARKGKTVTAFGRIADPIVDKVLILGSMIYLTVLPWSQPWLPTWMVVVVLARELLVTTIRGYVESIGVAFPADTFGKVKMVVQCIAVGAVLAMRAYDWNEDWYEIFSWTAHVLIWATVIATVGSGLNYAWKTRGLLLQGTP
jgi:CDP-diacylglycerol--glycerol-3-phosphate 3-phosphatidyltransferase